MSPVILGTLERLLLLLLLLLLLQAPRLYSSWVRIDKCCQPGSILALNDTGNLACERAARQSQLLLDPREDAVEGLPVCDEYSHLKSSLFEETDGKIVDGACLEIFSDKPSQDDFLVIVNCHSLAELDVRNNSKYTAEAPSLPKILNFRKCCPANSAYDVDKKFCIDNDADFKMLFQRFDNLDFIDVFNGPPKCEYALVDYKVETTDVNSDGEGLRIVVPWEGGVRNVTVDVDNGCLDVEASRKLVAARICSDADYCSSNACLRKCCPENKINNCLDARENRSMEKFRTLVASTAANNTRLPMLDLQRYALVVGRPCDLYYAGEPDEHWEIGSSGELLVPGYPTFTYVNSCIELMYNEPNFKNGLYPFYCFDAPDVSYSRYDTKAGLTLTSCCFLLATILVYACLPSLQNLHGKTLMCHVVSLFFAYACLAVIQVTTRRFLQTDNYTSNVICKCLGYLLLFSLHSTFFWLNVMCFDIWWTFRGMQASVSAVRKKRQHKNRFLTYCVYAWGLAFVLSGLSAVLEYVGLLSSSIGSDSCWFGNESIAEIIFFIGPVTVTLLINIIFFIITSYRCSKVKTEIKRAMANVEDPATRKFHSNKTRLLLNLKLFVVMGMPWILENIPAYLEHYQQLPAWTAEVLFLADLLNSLQGLWIFVLFVLKRKVYRALCKRLGRERKGDRRGLGNSRLDVRGPVRCSSASNSTLLSNLIANSSAG